MEATLSISTATLLPVLRASAQHAWTEKEEREESDFAKESQLILTLPRGHLEVALLQLYEVGPAVSAHRSRGLGLGRENGRAYLALES